MGKKILIVDDDPDFTEAISTLLESNGYDILSAPNAKEGLLKAKSEKPDLMLLDVMMTTKTEGFDMALKLKEDNDTKNIPIIMVTGIRRDLNLSFGFEPDENWMPVKSVIEKPVKPEVLLKKISDNIN